MWIVEYLKQHEGKEWKPEDTVEVMRQVKEIEKTAIACGRLERKEATACMRDAFGEIGITISPAPRTGAPVPLVPTGTLHRTGYTA